MFGIDTTILAFVLLAGLSAGAVAYALMFRTIENERKADRRLNEIKAAETDRSVVTATRDRLAEAAKRRKSVQDSLKDLDEKQKAKDRNVKKPPLRQQLKQAGMTVSVERFYLYSLLAGVAASNE
jgi:tight adherence protein B